jgi:hypothetical protein
MIVLYGGVIVNRSDYGNSNKSKTNKDDIINVKGCGPEIYFNANNKSQSGKWIPLDKDTGLPHQCQ